MGNRRAARLAGWAASGTAAVVAALLAPDLWGLLPRPVKSHPTVALLLSLLVGLGLVGAVGRVRSRRRVVRRARWLWLWADRLARRVGSGGLAWGVGLICAGMLLCWAPAYLTWPYCRDEDVFATLAMGWRRGGLPYRDVRSYNFPGHIYLHWVLGQVAGWGRTLPFYALDVLAVVGLGVAILGWSRLRLGGSLPGLVGYLAFLGYYLGVDYESVAERDWHASLLAALGLLAVEAWPGRRGRVASALGMALALTIRPHVVLFLPALGLAVVQNARDGREPALRAVGVWAAWLLGLTAIGFAPLVFAGIADDLAHGLRVASYGGPYSRATPGAVMEALTMPLGSPRLLEMLAALLATAIAGPCSIRPMARTWGLAVLGALAYGPLHPVQHVYLAHPRELFPAISLALPMAWLVRSARLPRAFRLIATLLVMVLVVPRPPRFCLPMDSLRAVADLARGAEPSVPPEGARRFFHPGRLQEDAYPWGDYLGALAYLRRETTASTLVANVLRRVPFPAINGPAGRPSPFLADSGICWGWLVDQNLDAEFADDLERAADSDARSVVVWSPGEPQIPPRMRLPRLVEVIRRRYQPEARFGPIEVWRRRPGAARPPEPLP